MSAAQVEGGRAPRATSTECLRSTRRQDGNKSGLPQPKSATFRTQRAAKSATKLAPATRVRTQPSRIKRTKDSNAEAGQKPANAGNTLPTGDDDAMRERREDEVMALQAILPSSDLLYSSKAAGDDGLASCTSLTLTVPVVLPRRAQVRVLQRRYRDCTKPDDVLAQAADLSLQSMDPKGMPPAAPHQSCHVDEAMLTAEDVLHLPPLNVLIRLPEGYPEHAAPQIVHMEAEYLGAALKQSHAGRHTSRLTRDAASKYAAGIRASGVQKLRAYLLRQYESIGGEILFTWYDTLKEGIWADILSASSHKRDLPFAGLGGTIQFDEAILAITHSAESSPLLNEVRAHDMLVRRKAFEGERFGCGICLEEMRGTKCWRIASCQHVFCQECLSGYLSSMIREGYIRQASACPDPECVNARAKAETQGPLSPDEANKESKAIEIIGMITEEELQRFVGAHLTQRLLDLQEKAAASTDPRAGYCPRTACGRLVRGDPADVGTAYEAMRQCSCGYTYCQYCGKAWHGRSPCDYGATRDLVESYRAACDNIDGYEKRRAMELKYGLANLLRMVKQYDEDRDNRAWLESNSQSCPSCDIRINRSHGCAHMTCKRCNTHFCYRCGVRLDPAAPYKHFNTPGLDCYMRLFELEEGQEAMAQREADDAAAIVAAFAAEE